MRRRVHTKDSDPSIVVQGNETDVPPQKPLRSNGLLWIVEGDNRAQLLHGVKLSSLHGKTWLLNSGDSHVDGCASLSFGEGEYHRH